MTANIRATCPSCGEVDLSAEEILLEISSEDESGVYWFKCPQCVEAISKPADARIIQLLKSGGVKARVAERGRPEDPPLTYDDLLEFHFELEDDRALQALLS